MHFTTPSTPFATSASRLARRRVHVPSSTLLALAAAFCLVVAPSGAAHAQEASFARGRVIDYTTRSPLEGVRIERLDAGSSTAAAALTDRYGRFQLRLAPGEAVTVRVRILAEGHQNLEAEIALPAPDTLEFALHNAESSPQGPSGLALADRVFATDRDATRRAGTRVEQIGDGLVTTLTAGDMRSAGAFTAVDGLARMAGVQVSREGELNIRGLGRASHAVLVDGQSMPSTIPSARFADLGAISADLIGGVRRIDLRTADRQAEGIGSAVDLDTWRPVGERRLSVSAAGVSGGGRYARFTGSGERLAVNYAERFTRAFSLAAAFSWQRESEGHESLGIDFLPVEFATGAADVPDRVAPGLGYDTGRRGGGHLQLTYEPDARSAYRVRALITVNRLEGVLHRNVYDAAGDWLDPLTTGLDGSDGSFHYNPRLDRDDLRLFLFSATGRHLTDRGVVSYEAGWARSVVEVNRYDFTFTEDRLDYALTSQDPLRPVLVPTNVNLMEDGTIDQRVINFAGTERVRDGHELTRLHARLDAATRLGPIELKAGAYLANLTKDRGYEDATLATLRTYPLLRFRKIPRSAFEILDLYHVPNLVEPADVARYLDTSRPDLRVDMNDLRRRTLVGNVSTDETEWAGYAMARVESGPWRLTAGLRYEGTASTLGGQRVLFNQFGFFESTADTSRRVSRADLFPSVVATYRPGPRLRLTAGYAKTIRRPDAALTAPFELVLPRDTLLYRGNPDLAPILADQLELRVSTGVGRSGELHLGAYHTRLSGRPFLDTLREALPDFPFLALEAGAPIRSRIATFRNRAGSALVQGIEVRWRQPLAALPGLLGHTTLEIGYLLSASQREERRDGEILPLLHQSPHALNLSLGYDRGRLSLRADGHWSAPSLATAALAERSAPSLPGAPVLYPDLVEQGWLDASFHAGFRISEQFRLWLDAENLLPRERTLYIEDPGVYPVHLRLQDAVRVLAGLRFDL